MCRRMTSISSTNSCDSPMTTICHENAAIERALAEKSGTHGRYDFPPNGWKDHADCLNCELTKKLLTYNVGKDNRKADSNTEYAFTLTMPPDYKPKKPIEEAARLILEKGLVSKTKEKACEWAFVKEHTEAGTPHIHGVYRTPSGRRIEAKYFHRYWDLWDEKFKLGHGHKGGYHAVARHSESYKAYMEKEGVVVKNPPHSQDLNPPHLDSPDLISHV